MIGERLAELRKDRGLSQQEFAEIFGLSTSTISSYEREVNEPDDSTKVKIAQYFNISLDYLLGATNQEIVLDRSNVLILQKDFPGSEMKTLQKFVEFIIYQHKNK